MTTIDKMEVLFELGYEDSMTIDGFDEAMMGYDDGGHVIYDYGKMVDILCRQGMSEESAEEYISYNIIRALPYYEMAPIICYGF